MSESLVPTSGARKVDPEQARAGFRLGLHRHYKNGLYLATGIVEDEESGQLRVIYRSIAYGKDYSRLIADAHQNAWSDHVLWPPPPSGIPAVPGRRHWPYGNWAPRFTLVAPFKALLLVDGPPSEGANETLELAREIEQVEVGPIYAGAQKTLAILSASMKVPVVPVWVSNVNHEPPEQHVRLLNGSRDFLLGQLRGVLACVDPSVVVETAGPPIVPPAE